MLTRLSGVQFDITTSADVYKSFEGPRLTYDFQPVSGGSELLIVPAGLLTEKGINTHQHTFVESDGIKALFPVYNRQTPLPYDPFSAAFYMVSRYEEYLPYMRDEHGRFSARSSLAFQQGFLQVPVVNHWALQLTRHLKALFPQLQLKSPLYTFLPTIDVDLAWSYRHKGLIRTLGGFGRDLAAFNLTEVRKRFRVLSGRERDPFDTYELLHSLHKTYNLKPWFFILFAGYGQFDKNIPVNSLHFQTLIKSISDYAHVGIHPSYASNGNPAMLAREIERLAQVVKAEITGSRQHFLKLSLPETYRNLIALDITDDFTMGFAAQPGFRAGICSPFTWYDLEAETITSLTIHPFAMMEGTLRDYLHLEATAAVPVIHALIDAVREVNGTFISLWHNESLSNEKRWAGWVEVYKTMLQYGVNASK